MLEKLKQTLGQPSTALSEFRAFLEWWLDELTSLLREGFSKSDIDPSLLMLDLSTGQYWFSGEQVRLTIYDWRPNYSPKDLADKLTDAFGDRQPTKLAISHDRFMEALVTVPVVARNNLEQFLSYDLDRYFPVSPENLSICIDYLRESEGAHDIEVKVTACLKRDLAYARELASLLNCDLKYLGPSLNKLDRGNLLGSHSAGHAPFGMLKAAAITILIGISFGALHFKTAAEKDRLKASFTSLQSDTRSLQSEVQAVQRRLAWLTELNRDYPMFLTSLNELTGSIGESGEIFYVVWDQKSLEWRGATDDTANMITRLVEGSSLSSIEYLSPVQTEGPAGSESFHLKAEVNQDTGKSR